VLRRFNDKKKQNRIGLRLPQEKDIGKTIDPMLDFDPSGQSGRRCRGTTCGLASRPWFNFQVQPPASNALIPFGWCTAGAQNSRDTV